MQPLRVAIAALGTDIGPPTREAAFRLFDAEQTALSQEWPATAVDVAYGSDPRHRLDLYAPRGATGPVPVVVWVHGGGFLRGDKGAADDWENANVGRALARAGFLGVVITYRLAPRDTWPAGAEDLAAVVAWLQEHAGDWGGDPERIVLSGTSAGATHVAGYLKLCPHHGERIRGAVMLSGVYGSVSLDDVRDRAYFGDDPALHAERIPFEAVADTDLPLFVACAEFDPPRFQAEFLDLLRSCVERHGRMPRSYVASGHNHYSMTYQLGTSDRRLEDEIASFVREVCR